MTSKTLLALLVQSLILLYWVGPDELGEAPCQHMREREELLSQETTRLLQELERESQSSSAWKVLPFAASQQWQFWAIAGVLVLLFGLCWWLRRRSHAPESGREVESSKNKKNIGKQEENPNAAMRVRRHLCMRSLDLPVSCMTVMNDLLNICQRNSKNSFFPVLQPPITLSFEFEQPVPHEYHGVCRLLVPLKAPRGHSFHLELGTTSEVLSKVYRIRVELECTCVKEQLEKDMLCFVHHPKEEPSRIQAPSLLDTFCTGSYLDVVKTACWFQRVVKSAWVVLPEAKDCCLTVLPSSRSCKVQLTSASSIPILIEMIFGVREDDLDTQQEQQISTATATSSRESPLLQGALPLAQS